ncbi:hypothetical protein BDR04DRAFT_1140968 [Suillus decipiens]|nr:hypothetical protein BDR04DRAFT_1140968 [Suillus decipiens]
MEPAIRFRFSDLPREIALMIFRYAAEPTFSQKEEYADKNPYATALSLCLVSRLVRRTILPQFLHTISLRRCLSLKMFANALRMQKAYAEKQSDLSVDYTSLVQRVWVGRDELFSLPFFRDIELEECMSLLLPVLLAAPELAIEYCYFNLVVRSAQNAWISRADPDVDNGPSLFPVKTKNLTIMSDYAGFHVFKYHRRRPSIFLESIRHLTYLVEIGTNRRTFHKISRGLEPPEPTLRDWMDDIPWGLMENLKTFSVVYPHMGTPREIFTYMEEIEGLDLHVERLTISVPLFKQDPKSFPWVTAPFPVTACGEKRIQSDGVSFKVTHDRVYFGEFSKWDKAWACGITD